jgi:hypothetical protein
MKNNNLSAKIIKTVLLIIPLVISLSFLSCQAAGIVRESREQIETEAGEISENPEETEGGAEETVASTEAEGEPQESEASKDTEEEIEVQYTGLCKNAYFPVKKDTYSKYDVKSPSDNYEFTSSFMDITDVSFIEKIESDVFIADIDWICLPEGMVQGEYSALVLEEDDEGMEFVTESYEGITIPSEDKWSVGYKWDIKYEVKTTTVVEGERMSFDGDILIKNEIVSLEAVTVPAGTFPESFKVSSDKSMAISTEMGGITMNFDVNTDISSWYVRDTGLVKQISKAKCGTTTVELLSMDE